MQVTERIQETIHGVVVQDPYRWLEEPSLPQTQEWIRHQQQECNRYFSSCPGFGSIERRVREYLDVEIIDHPAFVANRYFYRKRMVGEEQGAIYTRNTSTGEERVLVEPNRKTPYTSVGIYRISPDGNTLAYELKRSGSDRKEIHFVDVTTGSVASESISEGYARGLAFTARGCFYCHETDVDARDHTIYYRSLKSSGSKRAVFQTPRKRGSRLTLKANEHRLGAFWMHPERSSMFADFWISDLVDDAPEWKMVFSNRQMPYNPILCHDRIMVLEPDDSNNSQLIELSVDGEEMGTIVPARGIPIQQVAITRDRIFVSHLERSSTLIDSWSLGGEQSKSVNLPEPGSIQFHPLFTQSTDRFFFTFESFDCPPTIYEHHAETNASLRWHQQKRPKQIPASQIRETTVKSKDGTRVPLTLVSVGKDESPALNPVIMTSYGGFGISTTPKFSTIVTIMLELGFLFAMPHIRGGGEFGKAWHDAGRARNRQSSFDDFIAVAEWLCNRGITSPNRLAIFGGSNSGLLVGAAMTQRPDLFRAVLCIAPLLDMVRYERFEQTARWTREYGSVEDSLDFQALYAYSPYHQVAENINYPATLFVTGDQDDRCNPAHTRKMAALLQGRSAQKSAVIIDYSEERGHSPSLPLSIRVQALARRIVFLCRELDIPISNGGFDETTRD